MNIFTKLTLILTLTTSLFGQQPTTPKASAESHDPSPTFNFFKLAFVVYELEGSKRSNQRDYMMIVKTDNQPSSIRIGTRVPIYTEGKQVTYVDAGFTLRCSVKEQADRRLQLQCENEISNFIRPEQIAGSGNDAPPAPVMRTTKTSSWALLTLGKSTLFATVDDINSAKRMQIEVIATKVD